MTFAEWQSLSRRDPSASAREIRMRLGRLPASQRRAIMAWEPEEAALTEQLARSPDAPLSGIPYLLKDLFAVAGVPIRAGSSFLAEVRPPPLVDGALASAHSTAGAALAGKTHLHEFAYGLTGENPHFGNVEHPHLPGRTSGGSSSGSAAAVAAGVVPFAVGTDTGGSVRVPAAFCGLHGLRLTPGHPWISDAFPLAPSFDTAGWFTANASDLLRLVETMIGLRTIERPLHGCHFGFHAMGESAEPEILTAYDRTAAELAPAAEPVVADAFRQVCRSSARTYAVLQSTEAFALHAGWLDAHQDRYSAEVWQRIDRGRRWTADQVSEAHLQHSLMRLFWTQFFLTYDFAVLPSTPFAALKENERTLENRNRLLGLMAPASLAGLPVLALPIPLPGGRSTGLQVVVNSVLSPVLPRLLTRQSGD